MASAALIGFFLALVGLYAVVACQVARRTREIGIRVALGAARRQVMRMILRQAAATAVVGVSIGLLLSLAAGRALTMGRPQAAFDPLLYTLVPLGLADHSSGRRDSGASGSPHRSVTGAAAGVALY
jgi:ABC-type antimicrobial peptide transport system permease subunit